MGAEGAARPDTGAGREAERGELLYFPEKRAFGPLSWRTVRVASLALLVLIFLGALVDIFVGQALRQRSTGAPKAQSALP